MDSKALIDRYYQSLADKNDSWKALWSESGIFSDGSKTLYAEGKPAIVASFTPFLKGVTDIRVVERIISATSACYIVDYTYANRNQESMRQQVAEVWQDEAGQLKSLTIYFDITAYRNFMRG